MWGGSLGALGAFMAAIYPSIQSSIENVAKNYPAGLKQAFGVEAMNTVEGYVHAEMFSLIVPLAIGYFAIRAVAGAIVGAEERGDLDTILALPLSRAVLLVGSYFVAAIASGVILGLTGVMTFIAGRIAGTHISLGLVIAGSMGVWPLALFFAGVSALASAACSTAPGRSRALRSPYSSRCTHSTWPGVWPTGSGRSAGCRPFATTELRCGTASTPPHSSASPPPECSSSSLAPD